MVRAVRSAAVVPDQPGAEVARAHHPDRRDNGGHDREDGHDGADRGAGEEALRRVRAVPREDDEDDQEDDERDDDQAQLITELGVLVEESVPAASTSAAQRLGSLDPLLKAGVPVACPRSLTRS
ncbi:MAG: hypothetical protein ACJ72W_26475 [Actinoallomurus sp.]